MPANRARAFPLLLLLASAWLSNACAALNPPLHGSASAAGVHERIARVPLHGQPLTLHLAATGVPPATGVPLVLYASGDGGWFGAAVDMFHTIAAAGYPTVGLSSRSFLRLERPREAPLDETLLATDYRAILDEARTDLHLQPDTPVILTGWSRGAAFAVIAAARLTSVTAVDGIIAIGLDDGEDLKVNAAASDEDDDADGDDVATASAPRSPFETYSLLRALDPLRVAVIQATHDGYLPAARARELFGSDTGARRLLTVEARNHRFSGGRDAFQAALLDALAWTAQGTR